MLVCYWICPKAIIAEKKDYVNFFLCFFICYAALHGIISLAFGMQQIENVHVHVVFILALFPILFIAHLLYPFKTVKRNQHLSFFLFFAALLSMAIAGFFVLLAFSNM